MMTREATEIDTPPLGDFLRSVRCDQGLEISAVAEQTKISRKNLTAIENGSYGDLPADAYTRGFYRLYATMLCLDAEQILKRYDSEKASQGKTKGKTTTFLPGNDEQVNMLAERPSRVVLSSIGLILSMLLFLGAFLCWYFSWNPATFLSQKLRSMDKSPQPIEQVQLETVGPADIPQTMEIFSTAAFYTSDTDSDVPSSS
jgi:cytoskeleton protein RodZ